MKRLSFVVALVLISASANADGPTEAEKKMVRQQLAAFAPGMEFDSVDYSPVDNFFEVTIGTRVVYISRDGKHVFLGELLDVNSGDNLTEQRRSALTADKLNDYGAENMIVIGPEDAGRYVTVFTDVDCPYCAKFHRDVPALNKAGVQVRYLLFPRSGLQGRSYERAVGVWCADDPVESVGIAKAGGEVEYRECENPVKTHYALGQEIGIRGTPAIILDDGRTIAGYVPPRRLIEELGLVPEGQ
ncbi:DsbC family protein [Pseudomonadota bacterium]